MTDASHDLQELDRLLAEAQSLKYGPYPRALELAAQALRLAQRRGDYERFVRALLLEAWANAMLYQLEASLSGVLEALGLTRRYGYRELEARALNILATNFVQIGLHHEAEKLYDHQLTLSQSLDHAELEAIALHDWATLLNTDGVRAAAMLERAIDRLPPGVQDGLDLSVMKGTLSFVYLSLGRIDDALTQAAQALALAENKGAPVILCSAHLTLARVYFEINEETQFETQIRLAKSLSRTDDLLLAEERDVLFARYLWRKGRTAQALEILEQLYTFAIENEMFYAAQTTLELARQIYEEIDDKPGIISVYRRLTDEVPALRAKSGELRLQLLAMVFAQDKAMIQEQAALAEQKYELLNRISHEFRTPLTVIQSSSEIVAGYGEKMPLERRQKHLQTISGQVKSMTMMLENITALLEDPPDTRRKISLTKLAYITIARLENAGLETERIQMTTVPEHAEIFAPVDMIATAAFHLLHNALRYSSAGVDFELSAAPDALTLRITDSGIGIPQDEQNTVFEPLVRGSNQHEPTGGGLGLAIVARLVVQMAANLNLDSKINGGTTIALRIPMVSQTLP